MLSEAELLAADIAAREAALDVGRSFIVQAPAGSGKTELLIQRYLRLLAIVEDPEEVLAITFTKKAAAEMRERVLRALSAAAAGEEPTAHHEKITFVSASAVLERDRQRGWALLSAPRRLRIQTLDSFCAGVARGLPVTSGLGAGSTIVQDQAAGRLYESAATATLDWLVEENSASQAIETVLKHVDNNTSQYLRYLSGMLQSRDQWLQITGSGATDDPQAIRQRLERTIAEVIEHRLATVRERLTPVGESELMRLVRYATGNLRSSDKAGAGHDVLASAEQLPHARSERLDAWRRLADMFLTDNGSWRKRVTVNQGFPPGDDGQKADFMACLATMADVRGLEEILSEIKALPEPRYTDDQWAVLLALFRLLPLAVTELKRVFSENGACDHAEVAMAAAAALGSADEPGELALMLDYRISHLLVDEMQDTSIRQYAMLETLVAGWTGDDGRSFFCVGDPMQSIYRFRDAEVGQFIRAREEGLQNLSLEPLTLRRNFRSGEYLVHWFNTVFAQIFPDQDDADAGAIRYAESVPVEHLQSTGEQSLHPLFDVSAGDEARFTAELIESDLASTPDGIVAVLVRSRTQLPELLAELRSRSIDYQAVEIDRLTDLPEIIDLLALTRAIVHPGDRAAWLGLLRGPLVGLSWTDLHTLVADKRSATVWELIRDPLRRARLSESGQTLVERFLPTAEALLAVDRCRGLRDRVERAWFRLNGPACLANDDELANAYRYFDILERLEVAGTLADPARLYAALEAERVSSGAADGCRVQVMTMHKAKGLEFEHVILPFLGRFTSGSRRAVLNWLTVPTSGGQRELLISPVGAAFEQDSLHGFIEQTTKSGDRNELDRLLYVACTRARRSLRLVFNLGSSADGQRLLLPHSGSLINRLWAAVRSPVETAFNNRDEKAQTHADSQRDSVLRVPALRRLAPARNPGSIPPLPIEARAPADSRDEDIYQVQYEWVGAAARHAGTLVHKWLQRMALTGDLQSVKDPQARALTTRNWAGYLGVADAQLDDVVSRVDRALTATLDDEQGLWILAGEGFAELALTGLWRGEIRSIVIDRVRIVDGVHWIIDYKTSTHEGGGLDQFIDQEAARYEQQLDRYQQIYQAWSGAPAVRTALYFPMMKVFRVVDSA